MPILRGESAHILERDGNAICDFFGSSSYDFRSDKVQCTVVVFLSVLVEDSPGAALRVSTDCGEVVKVWDGAWVGRHVGGFLVVGSYWCIVYAGRPLR